ncbi:MAG TPA: DUF2088 domain-containing protein [Firmicutes bacterium]|nr:DUF2088 domain-containing protein [Bacillota bacterium]
MERDECVVRRLYAEGALAGLRPEGFSGVDVPLPRGLWVRQPLERGKITDIRSVLSEKMARSGVEARIRKGGRVAIAVGSRGLAGLPEIVASVAEAVRARGARPFIVPAMGSHGGATAEGQRQVLADYGISERTLGIEVRASMDVVEVGRLTSGVPVYFGREAYEADGVIVINRVKPHTCFRGPIESGLAKILTIGLGKHVGATSLHAAGFSRFPELIPEAARLILARTRVLFGVATVENATGEVALIEVVPAEDILRREPELLQIARRKMGRFLFDSCDVLVVDEIGKDISGDGMDPNVTGRYSEPTMAGVGGFQAQRIVVLGLTAEAHGNASGIGVADITTQDVLDRIDFVQMYTNAVTSRVLASARLPIVVPTARDAVALALLTVTGVRPEQARVVRIRNTLELERIWVSESMWEELSGRPGFEALTSVAPMDIQTGSRKRKG